VISLDAGMRRHDVLPPEGGGFTDPLFETLKLKSLENPTLPSLNLTADICGKLEKQGNLCLLFLNKL
jgi:hypothetical protein